MTEKNTLCSESEKKLSDILRKEDKRKRTYSESEQNQSLVELTQNDANIAAALAFCDTEFNGEKENGDSILATTSNHEQEKPTFQKEKVFIPSHMTKKGNSKSNIGKGKRPAIKICSVEGDLLYSSNLALSKRIYDLTEESYHNDRVERIRNTLKDRIGKLAEEKVYSLKELHTVFVQESIPLSLKLPTRLSTESLASLLVIEQNSSFIDTIKSSVNFQDTIRRQMLEEKNIPVCRCGFIYVHPILTYAKLAANPNSVAGQLGDGHLAIEKKEIVMEKLDKLRFFLEILYEYHST